MQQIEDIYHILQINFIYCGINSSIQNSKLMKLFKYQDWTTLLLYLFEKIKIYNFEIF